MRLQISDCRFQIDFRLISDYSEISNQSEIRNLKSAISEKANGVSGEGDVGRRQDDRAANRHPESRALCDDSGSARRYVRDFQTGEFIGGVARCSRENRSQFRHRLKRCQDAPIA
jgi:hypothetical protein